MLECLNTASTTLVLDDVGVCTDGSLAAHQDGTDAAQAARRVCCFHALYVRGEFDPWTTPTTLRWLLAIRDRRAGVGGCR